MDFLDPKKKKAQHTRLYIGYALVAILIGLGAVILLYASFGFGIDKSGNVVQNGLVFLASSPDAAQVKISNLDGSYKNTVVTDERLILKQDTYSYEFLKEGYRTWQKTLELRGGGLERLTYPFLFPDKLKATPVSSYSNKPGLITGSPNRQWLLSQEPNEAFAFDVIDTSLDEPKPTSVKFPAVVFPGAKVSTKLTVEEWSNDNRHLLISYKTGSITEFVLLDREKPAESINLNQRYGDNYKSIRLRDKKDDSFYLLSNKKQLYSANLGEKEPVKILSNVESFQPHGNDNVLFINSKNQTKTNKVLAQIWVNDQQVYTIRELPASKTYFLDLAQYENDWMVVVGASGGRDEVYIYRDPIGNIKRHNEATFSTRTLRLENAQNVSFSANTQFVAAQSGQKFVVYDADTDRQFRFAIKPVFDNSSNVDWMDGHRLTGVSKNKIVVFDFDGHNLQTLNSGISGLPPLFSEDYRFLYSTTKTRNKTTPYTLQSTDLRLPSNP